jgi:FtsP/CotA-like multicopper oxidase with cupredoxin domain
MAIRKLLTRVFSLLAISSLLLTTFMSVSAQAPTQAPTPPPAATPETGNPPPGYHGRPTPAERQAAAERAAATRGQAGPSMQAVPGGVPDYFGDTPNYANSPQAGVNATVTIGDLAVPGGAGATAVAYIGGLTGLTITPGAGCTIAPSAVITGGGGYGAAVSVALDGLGSITATLSNPGYLYASIPTVTLVGGTCATMPIITPAINPTAVTSIKVTAGGTGYISPTVTITSPTATASATATISQVAGVITSITVVSGGAGYGLVTNPATGRVNGIRKFVDSLPGLGPTGVNDIGQYIPVATPDISSYVGSDYYEIALVQFSQKLHADLPTTPLREYVQLETPSNVAVSKHIALTYPTGAPILNKAGQQIYAVDTPQYLGPLIVATKDKPVRIKFTNYLPTGVGGDLFIPVDTSYMGAGMGPVGTVTAISVTVRGTGFTSTPIVTLTGGGGTGAKAEALILNGGINQIRVTNPGTGYTSAPAVTVTGGGGTGARAVAITAGAAGAAYTENRATLHLHGGNTPWISDGTPHQWTTPAGENTPYPKGVTVYNVPDMPDPGDGSLTFFYTNQQSARFMFYHDHAYGITRLNVYAGEAAGYLIQDTVEQTLVNGGTLNGAAIAAGTVPAAQIPLVIQDKTFVDATTIAQQDPTWNWGSTPGTPRTGDLWFPHVYMPNQNPYDLMGVNAMGRWDYGPWFWPPFTTIANGPVPNPLFGTTPEEGPVNPGIPNPSGVPEGFMDTPLVNGTAYPYLNLQPQAYRFRILAAGNDRYFNLSWFVAEDPINPMYALSGTVPVTMTNPANGEVRMVAAVPNAGLPTSWPTDGRDGGVPDPAAAGPAWLQIGTEGGLLPALSVVPATPIGYDYNRRAITVLNVLNHGLFLGPAERADVVVDFSAYAGKTLILYNDAPAPVPAFDPRNDYYTNDPDNTSTGGAPSTLAGYGPNTRTIMQVRIAAAAPVTFNQTALAAALPNAFHDGQPTVIVPQAPYNAAYGVTNFPSDTRAYARIADTTHTWTPVGATSPVTLGLEPKAIQELFTLDYGRMNATLGFELPSTNGINQTTIPTGYIDPPTEIFTDTVPGTQIGVLTDGTQLWKITHNGVDTHAIHFHMFDVQVLNRVGWDGQVKPPDANEIGWKDTVRMNPLEDVVIAIRHIKPGLPFTLSNSYRPLDVTEAPNTAMPNQFTNIDLLGQPATVVNAVVNFGWEYVWHCHLLGHEENDMMHAMILAVAPNTPTGLTLTSLGGPQRAHLTWSDASLNTTHYTIQRATDAAFTQNLTSFVIPKAPNGTQVYDDTTVIGGITYYYRVMSSNIVGYTQTYAAPAVGYPHQSADSIPTAAVSVQFPIQPPTNLQAARGILPRTIRLTWNRGQTTAITGIEVWRRTSTTAPWVLVTAAVAPTANTYTDAGLTAGVLYYYQIRSYIGGATPVYSAWSNVASSRPR